MIMASTSTLSESLYITQVRFCRALAVVRSLPTESGGAFQPSIADKLDFYGLYKQALNGDCMLLKPSSRKVVAYAKWKAWDKMRGVSPIDAQIMYINALVELLKEFLNRFPNSELTESLNESVHYLLEVNEDINTDTAEEENLIQWDTNDQEKEEYHLGQIEQEQILSEQPYSHYSSPIISEFPLTPELSPKSRNLYNTQPFDEEDEFDNEVATATSSLYLSTPTQHPYANFRRQKKRKPSDVAIQTLKTEVAALCEEIDSLRRRDILKRKSSHRWRWLWLFRSVAKHAFFNFVILMILFLVLWRRKSPIAYAVITYAGPRLRDLMQYMFNRIVFWKVTV
ncbi:uncharacterized protein ATC70_005487 [Mucor velutinosus]|uniref:ACB domain-containing protein n=1 Tax=Mucor velutinosus TaxID=708070 RepID=A0AAN7HYZ9_9FUNG|nr:hypothetical protein ATC70_005487 [Mucor velutinosus]